MISAKAENEVIRNHSIMKEPSFARMGGRETFVEQKVIDWFLHSKRSEPQTTACGKEIIEIWGWQGGGHKRMVRSNFDDEVKIMSAPQIDFAAR